MNRMNDFIIYSLHRKIIIYAFKNVDYDCMHSKMSITIVLNTKLYFYLENMNFYPG